MPDPPFDEVEDNGPRVWIVEERPPLRESKVFVDYDERATIAENLEAAYVALNQAFRWDLDPEGPGLGPGPRVLGRRRHRRVGGAHPRRQRRD